ncbi:MAG: hypothetical protein ING44_00090 [Telmatospirillum sp.]|nr:hypothetical protein [Telmatospirillum sp.]
MTDPANKLSAVPAEPAFEVPEGTIYIGSNSVARWFIELGFNQGKPCLLAKQVFLDAPKNQTAISRSLAAGRVFFSLKQLEMLMQVRHHMEINVPDYERVRIAAHLGSG